MNEIDDDNFWTNPGAVGAVFDRRFEDGTPFLAALGPSHFDPSRREGLPFRFAQAGTARDFLAGGLLSEGRIALVDLDRSTLRVADVDVPKGDLPPRDPVEDVDLDDPAVGMASREIDLCKDRFPGIEREIGRYRLWGILPAAQTDSVDFRIGPSDPDFQEALRKALEPIPLRTSVPDSFLAQDKSWKAVAIPSGFPEGISLEFVPDGDRLFAVASTALPEAPGELLHLEPGAVLPNGTRPPDALRTIHLVACSSSGTFLASLEIPVNGSPVDSLLRGSILVDLDRVFPGWRGLGILSLRLFCAGRMVGPRLLPVVP